MATERSRRQDERLKDIHAWRQQVRTPAATEDYRENYDRIFRKEKAESGAREG